MLVQWKLPYIDLGAPGRGLRHFAARVRAVRKVMQERRALAAMDPRMLSDIGLSRAESEAEINRKPWDIAPR